MSNISGIIYFFLILCSTLTHAFKYGAPPYICKKPSPIHGSFTAQPTPCPFMLSAFVVNSDSGIVKVRIDPMINSSSDYFTGYLIRIKDISPFLAKSIGTGSFTLEHADGTVFQCQDEPTSAITHDTNSKKQALEVKWQAPSGFTGEVIFTTSIVADFTRFWLGVESSPIMVSRAPLPSQIADESNQPLNTTLLKMHEGCGRKKNCLHTPNDCVTTKSCDALLNIALVNGVYEVEMFSKSAKFVCIGISADYGMGADAITECVFEDPDVKAYRSWNVPRRKTNKRLNDHSKVKLIHGVYENGLIYCKIEISPTFIIDGYEFDLNNKWYYVTLASGRDIFETKPGVAYHDRYRVSPLGRFYLPVITADPNDEFFYKDCNDKAVCHGSPGTCVSTKNCVFATSVQVQDHKFIVSLLSHNSLYVAVGFTEDQRRNNDHIVECLNNGSQVQTYRSWNVPDVFDNQRMGQTGLELLEGKVIENGLQCKVAFDPSVIPSFKLDLEYYLILAGGSTLGEEKVGYHNLARIFNDKTIGLYTNSSREVRDELFYNGCAESRTCLGHPDGCIANKSCDYAVSIASDNVRNMFSFHIVGNKSPGYVAVGLSDDQIMGNDLVVECVNLGNGSAKAYLSYNEAGTKSNKRIPQKPSFFMPTYGLYNNQKLECIALIEHPQITVENKSFDLLNDKYFLMMAVGNLAPVPSKNLHYHNVFYIVSSKAQTLRVFKSIRVLSRIPVYIHGVLMVASWIGLSGIGIIVARYYKTIWNDEDSVFGHWFVWHKYCLGSTAVFTLIGTMIIYFYCGRIIIDVGLNHTFLGFITVSLTFLQSVLAILRPAPSSAKRILFNMNHWFVGNALHVVAIVTIFLTVNLNKAQLPQYTYWVLTGYVIHYIIVHLLLMIVNDVHAHASEKETQVKNGSDSKGSQKLDKHLIKLTYCRFKNRIFKYHLAATIVFVLLMVILILSKEFYQSE